MDWRIERRIELERFEKFKFSVSLFVWSRSVYRNFAILISPAVFIKM